MPDISLPSIQSLRLQMQFQGHPLATGTGFVVMSGPHPLLITNRHNVTGRHQQTKQPISLTGGVPDEIVISQNQINSPGVWVPKTETLYNSEEPRWIEHPTLGAQADFVALPLTNIHCVHFYPHDLVDPGPRISVGPADVVSVVGFPFDLQVGGSLAVWATGFVASEPAVDFENLPTFLIDCRSRPGQSGSAVIAYRSGGVVKYEDGSNAISGGPVTRLLGIYSGRINEQSDLGIVWKAQAIRELVRSIT